MFSLVSILQDPYIAEHIKDKETVDLTELLKVKEKQVSELQQLIHRLVKENEELTQKINNLEEENRVYKNIVKILVCNKE